MTGSSQGCRGPASAVVTQTPTDAAAQAFCRMGSGNGPYAENFKFVLKL